LGAAALTTLLRAEDEPQTAGLHFPAKAKRVIFLHQSGAPSQLDLFDPKPELTRRRGEELPPSIRKGQRLTSMTSDQATLPLTPSLFSFRKHGRSGASLSELLPHTAKVVDELCFVRSLHTEAINHDPGVTFMQTGSEQPGRPSLGAWLSYGLGSENEDLPAFMVFVSGGSPGDQPLFKRLWGTAFLPGEHAGVKMRPGREPVLYLANPPGVSRKLRSQSIDALARLERANPRAAADPRIAARIKQYEMAFRMQSSLPDVVDLNGEPAHVVESYGKDAQVPGSYARNCLLARRLVERGVRFVQLYHRGWDHHLHLPGRIRRKCEETDQPSAALIADLKRLGMLDDTLVVWAGEFGRTSYCQGDLTADDYGRDHHPRCFTVWLAGGGVRAGHTHGATDEFSYNVIGDGVHIHDLQATMLHCLGIDHERLTYRSQGRDFRLTDIAGRVVNEILA
jgi:hypothetical protein